MLIAKIGHNLLSTMYNGRWNESDNNNNNGNVNVNQVNQMVKYKILTSFLANQLCKLRWHSLNTSQEISLFS